MSAGSHPTGQVHPRSLALLAREGISTAGVHSKSWDNLPAMPDIVVTVCASGADAEIDAAFARAYRILRARIEALLALPLATLAHDKAALKAAMDRIAALTA